VPDPRTYVYIDGFNLYHRLLASNPALKWLDLEHWCRLLLPDCHVERIRYFTAVVKARPSDPDKPVRQQIYLRALRTLPTVSIHLGLFKTREKRMWLKNPAIGGPNTALVLYEEEKRSDVNLASFLLMDGFRGAYELAVVISDDSDLRLPIVMVTKELGLPVWVLNPQQGQASSLHTVVTHYRTLRVGPLSGSQFPPKLRDGHGEFTRPNTWTEPPKS
jgi:hypothetical protein